jgi:DNA-binding PadR family transcriptional regulator
MNRHQIQDQDNIEGSFDDGPRRGGGGGRGKGRPGGGRGRGRSGGGRGHRHGKVSRGDVRIGILALLAEEPMHGYQIMQELKDRSEGAWQPSAGSIYPTLQQLADEGLVSSKDEGGRKTFSLTESGSVTNEETTAPPPWEALAGDAQFVTMRKTMQSVLAAVKQVAQVGTPEQVEAATEILTETRQRLYKVLAE